MLRLLQGDVGSGKTVVALLAMASAIEAGRQAALMAPTEILARQHFERDRAARRAGRAARRAADRPERGAERRATLRRLAEGAVDIAVGTHALFQEGVAFRDLGLAVVDEQHRFGVHQRLALGGKGEAVDMLVMTATPIPRTLVLTYFGDMDVSVSTRSRPAASRSTTRAVPIDRLDEVVGAIGRASRGRRRAVYWVCPLVEESERVDLAAAEDRFARPASRMFGDAVGLVHGQLPGAREGRRDGALRRAARPRSWSRRR